MLAPLQTPHRQGERHGNKKLGVVDVLFYLAGLILYAALGVAAAQTGDRSTMYSLILLIPGLLLWVVTYLLGRRPGQSETMQGALSAILLTGCLSVITGGVAAAYQTSHDSGAIASYVIGAELVIVGSVHLFFDRIYRHVMLVVFGMFLLVSAFPTVLAGLLSSTTVPMDVWSIIAIATGVLLGYGGVIAAKTTQDRAYLLRPFMSVAGFVVLSSAYIASVASQAAVLWEVVLPLMIYAAFFYSVRQRSQQFLVTGSIFLSLFLISMSFKYFSGLGTSFCLVLSGIALLGTAFLATSISKRYIKNV